MHYFIDGYNLLFRSAWSRHSDNLEEMRSKLITELDSEAQLLHLNITLVFDAPLLLEGLQRGHFRSLEIIYTSHGQTADEFLLSVLEECRRPQEVTLVTSDKGLRNKARVFGVHVEPVEQFVSWLKKRIIKKKMKAKSEKLAPITEKKAATTPQAKKSKKIQPAPLKQDPEEFKEPDRIQKHKKGTLPPLTDILKWEKIFEERLSSFEK